MNIELSKEEILRIQDWFGYSESEGHIEDKDWEIYKKLKQPLEMIKTKPTPPSVKVVYAEKL